MTSPEPPPYGPAGPALPVFEVDQPFTGDGLYELRETLGAHADRLGADEDQIDHLLIVASELATNAVRHGGGGGRIRLWQRDDALFCQVSDDGPGIVGGSAGHVRPSPTAGDGGRGLWICRHLTAELSIETGPDGTTVTAAIPGRPYR
ncbi:ATP-binding protein [Actinoplanes sp. L3-i22]|uniref:ATP-binding protein n=1 Tax=Actinoplanes sp. L3-i22 TaxID=2836373 RepID=UPI001C85703C|nr:ATP-binding protein [Actinoplanes sp. L3-i22]